MAQSEFLWQQQPEAEGELQAILKHACNKNQTLRQLDHDLIHISSTRLFDWIDHYSLPMKDATMKRLTAVGYQTCEDSEKRTVLNHPGAVLPMISLRKDKGSQTGVAVKVESIASYQQAHGLSGTIEGSPLSGFRRCLISSEGGVDFYVTERRGTRTLDPTFEDSSYLSRYHQASELWKGRARGLADSDEAMQRTEACVDRMVQLVGKDLAAWIAMEGEREYWQGRNTAGHVQKGRQDRLGMGWANHDHHTFRSSRHFFRHLVNLMEKMGFHCRERFYAGKEAGWGAQVMENSTCGIVLFLDVDLAPEELHIDFAHDPLPDLGRLGTIGLWCALHGDSVLNAGMHHLEAQFNFEGLRKDLHDLGVGMMKPFSDFPYLKQAFTEGEVWKVCPAKVDALLAAKLIHPAEAERFKKYGAVGSHLENLERNAGYKGFNQKNVSFIIKETDPRRLSENLS